MTVYYFILIISYSEGSVSSFSYYGIFFRLIIDKKERKLKKGSGFHLDIVLVCMMNMVCGFIGGPWLSAATVRSVSHVSALTVMSRTHAPGDKPHLIEVKGTHIKSKTIFPFALI